MREASQLDWAKIRELPAEQRQTKMAEYREKRAKQTEEVRKQVEAVLLPHQVDRMKKINFRTYGASMLASPYTLDRREVSDEQKGRSDSSASRCRRRSASSSRRPSRGRAIC